MASGWLMGLRSQGGGAFAPELRLGFDSGDVAQQLGLVGIEDFKHLLIDGRIVETDFSQACRQVLQMLVRGVRRRLLRSLCAHSAAPMVQRPERGNGTKQASNAL